MSDSSETDKVSKPVPADVRPQTDFDKGLDWQTMFPTDARRAALIRVLRRALLDIRRADLAAEADRARQEAASDNRGRAAEG